MTAPSSHPAPLRAALVGYGSAGRIFHAPLLSGVPGLALACIATSKPAQAQADWPGVRTVAAPQQAFDDPAIDLVVIATDNASHHPLARAALLAGKHVVVDKPCTVTLAETDDLLALAQAQGLVLTVFQNRRYDADFLALRQVLDGGQLGRIVHVASHFDRYRPQVLDRWRDRDLPGAGLWVDLGSHLVDQALQLFGCPDELLLDLARQRDGAQTNDFFHAQLRYERTHPGLRVTLHASALAPAPGLRWRVQGTQGAFVKEGLDPQEDALRAGQRPCLDLQGRAPARWGHDPRPGQLVLPAGIPAEQPAPAPPGNYLQYYASLRDHLRDHLRGAGPLAVTPVQVRQVMGLLARGEQSAREGRFVDTSDLAAAA
ncbi:oxidoreductase [Variovorax terrae]|uniref:Oxidoreductase n=1 Tax=Variovorax terrae TaxID=2923278 RepID=A0A9X2AQR4_9BURK|nr:oxidoreductase [Variovorax terrae]MCJ0763476.1 oxidoreductase [Variovorax terrae]